MELTVFVIAIVYILIGMAVGKYWYQRRHGVSIKVINGGANVIFSSVFPISFIWPVFLFIPSLRDPELCRHPGHILARDAARADYEQYQAAAERDEQYRRH